MPSPAAEGSTAPRPAPAVYRLDDLVIDTGRLAVLRGDAEIPLPRLSFDLLVALTESAPDVVTLEQLMERVWPGLVVSPETVSQRVKLLRDALDDDARRPRYVAGVRGRGYRIAQPVLRLEPGAVPGAVVSVAESRGAPPLPSGSRRGLAVALVVVGLAIALAAFWLLRGADRTVTADGGETPNTAQRERSIAVLPFEYLGTATGMEDLALGVPDTVLHQLARLPGVTVIARSSSFALRGRDLDAREVGRRLGVRFLLEGSVQASGERLRVTANLIETTTGSSVWSVQFDRGLRDVFAIQDEIAAQVARALEATLEAQARLVSDPLRGGTADVEAYLTFLRGRALLESLRVADLPAAIDAFRTAIRLDPRFAAARVQLARARVAAAQQLPAGEGQQHFRSELDAALQLLDEAIALDPQGGEGYVERGHLRLHTDLAGANADLRRGLDLAPSSARAYEGLAAVLFQSAARRREALDMIRQAMRIDPLEPRLGVIEATYLLYGPGDAAQAEERLQAVLERDPLYVPALVRLGELRWCCQGRIADALWVTEQAVALDPGNGTAWRQLADAYLSLGEFETAETLLPKALQEADALKLGLLVNRGEWRAAGELAHSMIRSGNLRPTDERRVALAIRRHAHLTGDFERGIETLEQWTAVEWDEGTPVLQGGLGLGISVAGLAELLAADGQSVRARALAEALLEDMDLQLEHFGRGPIWLGQGRAIALAVLGRDGEVVETLGRQLQAGALLLEWRLSVTEEPAFDRLRSAPAFQELESAIAERVRHEQDELRRMRQQGLVSRRAPDR